jgi:hypothetical protein
MQPTSFLGNEFLILNKITLLIRATPMLYLQIIVLVLWVFLFFYLKKMLRQKRRFLVAALFCLLASSALVLVFKQLLSSRTYLFTNTDHAAIYSGPGKNFTILGHLQANEELIKLSEHEQFIKVRYKGSIVWIGAHNVKKAT